jgi:hypothetical protein
MGLNLAPEATMTGWHLSSGKERGGSDGQSIVTDAATPSGRQRTARRAAVMAASGAKVRP